MKKTGENPFTALFALSPREAGAWACLIVTSLIYGPYFLRVWRTFAAGELTGATLLEIFVAAVISQIVLLVAIHIVIAIVLKDEPKDERDRAIENKSSRLAYNVLSIGIVIAAISIVLIPLKQAPPVARYLDPIFLSQAFLFLAILAEIVQYGSQVIFYRRGR